MKKITLSMVIFAITVCLFAQPPQAFKYQAIVRDNSGNIIANETINVRISIRDDWSGGTVIYQETHSATTNQFGLITLNVGWGTPVVGYSFLNIDWTYFQKFIEVEVDLTGGGSYVSVGTSQLLSVPYSIHSDGSNDWIRDGNNLYSANSGDIGIGTNLPNAKLDVIGGTNMAILGNSSESYAINGKSSGNGVAGVIGQGLTSSSWGVYGYNGYGGVGVRGYSSGGWAGYFVGDLYVYGTTGLGTQYPDYPLHVKKSHDDWLVGFHNESWESAAHGLVTRAEAGDPLLAQSSYGNLFIVKNNGRIGIGTTNPGDKLEIFGNGSTSGLRVKYSSSYSALFGEFKHAGSGGLLINANAGGSWAKMAFQTDGITQMVIQKDGQVGIGTDSPIRRLQVNAVGSEDAIQGWSPEGTGVYAVSASSYGVFGQSSVYYAGYFSGPVHVTGYLSKGSGSFVIDHPLDPENKLLRHNFVESPENLLIYRGKVELNAAGEATVSLPEYFKALTKEDEASIHLTPVGRPFLTGAEWNKDYSAIIIYGDPNKEVFWEVLADRDDPVIHELGRPVEEEKGGEHSLCEKGKLLYPEAYGYPETSGRDYERKTEAIKNSK